MCNTAGDGVEFGVFIDQECKQYHTHKSFENVISDDDWSMLYKMPSVIEFMFTSSISCEDDSNVQYINAYQPVYGEDDETCENYDDINQSCLDLFQENAQGSSLADCARRRTEEVDWDEQAMTQQQLNQAWRTNDVYSYDLSGSAYADNSAVCSVIASKYLNGHSNLYRHDGMFDYNSAKNNYYNADQHDQVINAGGKKDGLSVGEKISFYLLGLGALAMVGLAAMRIVKAQTPQTLERTGSKDLPLMA